MRTTCELDPDVVRAVDELRRRRRITRNAALNELARAGIARTRRPCEPFVQVTHPLGAAP